MRQRMDEESQKTGLNFTLLATPAEGLSGRFVRIDQKMLRRIGPASPTGSTTPTPSTSRCTTPSAPLKRSRKRPRTTPLTNAGHISYVELDGDVCKNMDAFEASSAT